MAAIDKLYVKTYDEYLKFADWCRKQPLLTDKYGRHEPISNYMYRYDEPFEGEHPVFNAPCFVDAYLIRNCPLEYIQNELKVHYGSSYQEIKDGKEYATPASETTPYEVGTRFNCVTHPKTRYNNPFGCKNWFVDIITPKDCIMWYHKDTRTWDLCEDYVIAKSFSSATYCKTIRALKRLMRKWKLPVGTIVRALGGYTFDTYEFIIKK